MSLLESLQSLRRTAAQRGVRHAWGNVMHRLRTGNFSTAPQSVLVRPGTHPFDEREGVETGGFIHGSALKTGSVNDLYSVAYYGTAPSLFLGALERWQATPGIAPLGTLSFVDFGSGKGRVLLMASRLPFKQCIGVEMHPGLHGIATENIARWETQGKAVCPVESRCVDATQFTFPAGPCVAYLFNPFAAKVLGEVIAHMAREFAGRPGELEVIYVNSEFDTLFAGHGGFTQMWREPVRMSEEDAAVDLEQVGTDHLGVPGQQPCTCWRWVGLP